MSKLVVIAFVVRFRLITTRPLVACSKSTPLLQNLDRGSFVRSARGYIASRRPSEENETPLLKPTFGEESRAYSVGWHNVIFFTRSFDVVAAMPIQRETHPAKRQLVRRPVKRRKINDAKNASFMSLLSPP